MIDDVRLAWRHQRLEVATLLGGSLLLALAIVILAWRLDAAGEALSACMGRFAPTEMNELTCRTESELANLLLGAATVTGPVAAFVPLAAGVFLGAPLVAGEIEHRTASMAWSLNASRRRWLVRRIAPIFATYLVAIGLLAGANHLLFLAASPDGDIGFGWYGMSGVLMVARGFGVLAIGVVVGVVIGRVLPAILVTGLLVIALFVGVSVGRDMLMRAEAEWVAEGPEMMSDGQMYDSAFRDDATGEVITWDEMYRRHPEEIETGELPLPGTSMVALVLPSERLPSFVARESAVFGGLVLVSTVLSLAFVGSRRPL